MRVVVLSEVKWRYMRTRKRFIVAEFPADWQVLFVEPMNRTARSHFWPVRDGRVTVATVPVLKHGTTVPALNRLLASRVFRFLIDALVAVWLRVLVLVWGRGSPRVLYLSNILFTPAARRLRHDLFLYDCNDDPLGFQGALPWMSDYMQVTLDSADLVVSCSRALGRRLEERGAGAVEVIGNGVEFDHFAAPVDPARIDERIRGLGRPRIGYAGAISNWFDFDLVEAVARRYADHPLVLMGPIAADVNERAGRLAADCPNVLLTGAIAYEDLPANVGSLDVCLIPFRVGALTDVLNPNKLYEYLAAGRMVVTLAYSEDVEAFADSIWVAKDAGEFLDMVGEALESPKHVDALRRVGRDNSWAARARAMSDRIERAVAERRGAPA